MSDQPVTYGLRLPNSGPFATAENVLAAALGAADAGFNTVWVHDHITWAAEKLTHFATGSIEACDGQLPNFLESTTSVAYLAGRVPGVEVGIAGLVLPLRDPRVLAKQLATLSRFAPRGLVVALAIGNIPDDFSVMGVPHNRRGKIATDYWKCLREILGSAQPLSYAGDCVSFSDGTFYPPADKLTMLCTGSSDAGLARAARYGDGWMTVYEPIGEYRAKVEKVRRFAREAGRDPEQLEFAYETYVCVGETREKAISISRNSLEHKFNTLERGLACCLVGTPDDVLEQIDAYAAEGAERFEIKFICHDMAQLADMTAMFGGAIHSRQAEVSGLSGTTEGAQTI